MLCGYHRRWSAGKVRDRTQPTAGLISWISETTVDPAYWRPTTGPLHLLLLHPSISVYFWSYPALSQPTTIPMPLLYQFRASIALPLRLSRHLPVSRPFHRQVSTHSHTHFEKAISSIITTVDTSSPEYKQNVDQMSDLTTSLRNLHRKIALGGPEKAREKHLARNKLLPRE